MTDRRGIEPLNSHATFAPAREEVRNARESLSREALRADPHADLRAGRIRLRQRRDGHGNRRAARIEQCAGRGDPGVLRDAAAQARRQAPRPGLHQRDLHAARRLRDTGPRQAPAGDRAQGDHQGRYFLAGRGRVHRRVHGRAGHAGQLRLLRGCDALQVRPRYRRPRRRAQSATRAGHHRSAAPAPSAGDPAHQQALGHPQFAQHRSLPAARWLPGAGKGPEGDDAGKHHRGSEEIEPAGARRGGILRGDEVGLRAQGFAEAEIRDLQRGRERAGHVQGPPADGDGPAPAHRRHRYCRAGHRRAPRFHLHPRRVPLRPGYRRRRHRRGLRARLSGKEHSRVGLRFRSIDPHRRGGLRVRRRVRADGIAGRQARLPAHQASLPRGGGPLRLPDDHQ